MVTTTKNIITKEELECYLPYPLKYQPEKDREGNIQEAYRTHLDPDSRSGTPVSINLVKGVYYDFKYGHGGSIVSLLRQVGAPISRDMAEGSQRHYKSEYKKLQWFKKEGRYRGCNKTSAWLVNHKTHIIAEGRRVMCLKPDCPYCAPFLERVYTEHLADYHAGAIFLIQKQWYKEASQALNRIKQKARRAGGKFIWWLLLSNDVQILFVDSRSSHEVIEWLKDELIFVLQKLNPTWSERQHWMERGLELMTEPTNWQQKFRHSREIPPLLPSRKSETDVDSSLNNTESNRELSTDNQDTAPNDDAEAAIFDTEPGERERSDWEWRLSFMPLEKVVERLEMGTVYKPDWRSDRIVRLIEIEPGGG